MRTLPVNISNQVQLFIDNHMVEMVNFVTRTLHQPKKYDQNPIMQKDKPWEIVPYFRTNTWNVCLDPQEKHYKCWYEDLGLDHDLFLGRRDASGDPIDASFHDACNHRYLYAESADGIHWDKPELDYRVIDGRKTNICLGDKDFGKVHAWSILLDPLDDDRSKRFKGIMWHEQTGFIDSSIRAVHSADGRHWTPYEQPLEFGACTDRPLGDVIIVTADPISGEYCLDTRAIGMCQRTFNPKLPATKAWGEPYHPDDPWGMSKRRVFSTTSRDFVHWTMLDETVVPDDVEDKLDDEFYGLTRFRIGDLYVGFLDIFHRTHNTKTVHLVCSRNGHDWNRVHRGEPFLNLGPEGQWDCYMVETCNQPIFLDDEIRIYYGGANLHHDWWEQGQREGLDVPEAQPGFGGGQMGLGLSTLRPEGFVSIDATVREGILVTRPFISDGTRLTVNVECGSKGYFDAELTDADDDVVPGFERLSCDTFRGDSTRHVVAWNAKAALPRQILAKGAKLRFFSRHASLYAFRIEDTGGTA